jgi:WD40 repeat protein
MTDNSQLIFASNIPLPDGSRVKRTALGKFRRIWNVTTGKVEAELKGHTDWVMSVAFSQDGSRVVSGSRRQNGPNLECRDGRGGG